jgi:hypothetical protein
MTTPIYFGKLQSDLDFAGFTALNASFDTSGAGLSGVTPLVNGQNYVDVSFPIEQDDTEWVLTGCCVVNVLDVIPLNLAPGIITAKTTTGFRLQLDGIPDSGNYELQWAIGMTSGGTTGGGGGGGGGSTVISVGYAATINLDAGLAPDGGTLIVQVGTLTGNVTLANPTSPTNRQRIEYVLKQDGTGGRTLTLGTKFRIPSSSSLVSPITSSNNPDFTAANRKARVMAEYDQADDKWDLIGFVPGY